MDSFILFLSLDYQQISLDLFLELVGYTRFIDYLIVRFSLKVVKRYIILLLINGFHFLLEPLLVGNALLVNVNDAILLDLFSIGGRNFW
jgi:hypothetical protein